MGFVNYFKFDLKYWFAMADFWKPTSDAFSALIDKPKMT
jgi:hypothetical protein